MKHVKCITVKHYFSETLKLQLRLYKKFFFISLLNVFHTSLLPIQMESRNPSPLPPVHQTIGLKIDVDYARILAMLLDHYSSLFYKYLG